MKRPKLDQMTTEQRLKYLEDTDHLVVKWVNRFTRPDGRIMYHREDLPYLTGKLCEATLYDTKYFAQKITEFELVVITKKQLFEARLKDA